LLQLTLAIAAVSSSWLVSGGDTGLAHEHHHKHVNHWKMITQDLANWPPKCDGELVDEGITHAHALLSANRDAVHANPGLEEWIQQDAN
jgi:hypothetical protein